MYDYIRLIFDLYSQPIDDAQIDKFYHNSKRLVWHNDKTRVFVVFFLY